MSEQQKSPPSPWRKWLSYYFLWGFSEQTAAVLVGLATLAWSGSKGLVWKNLGLSACAAAFWLLIAALLHPRDDSEDDEAK